MLFRAQQPGLFADVQPHLFCPDLPGLSPNSVGRATASLCGSTIAADVSSNATIFAENCWSDCLFYCHEFIFRPGRWEKVVGDTLLCLAATEPCVLIMLIIFFFFDHLSSSILACDIEGRDFGAGCGLHRP